MHQLFNSYFIPGRWGGGGGGGLTGYEAVSFEEAWIRDGRSLLVIKEAWNRELRGSRQFVLPRIAKQTNKQSSEKIYKMVERNVFGSIQNRLKQFDRGNNKKKKT
jgi:hypothetical protein